MHLGDYEKVGKEGSKRGQGPEGGEKSVRVPPLGCEHHQCPKWEYI
jgi:hypothetical protein